MRRREYTNHMRALGPLSAMRFRAVSRSRLGILLVALAVLMGVSGCTPQLDVVILSPATGSSYEAGEMIVFVAEARRSSGRLVEEAGYWWYSDLDGEIGFAASLSVDSLSVGTHQITVDVIADPIAMGDAGVTITIVDSSDGGEE